MDKLEIDRSVLQKVASFYPMQVQQTKASNQTFVARQVPTDDHTEGRGHGPKLRNCHTLAAWVDLPNYGDISSTDAGVGRRGGVEGGGSRHNKGINCKFLSDAATLSQIMQSLAILIIFRLPGHALCPMLSCLITFGLDTPPPHARVEVRCLEIYA